MTKLINVQQLEKAVKGVNANYHQKNVNRWLINVRIKIGKKMLIGLHDAEKDYFKDSKTFPNYALMKILAWYKAQGDTVEW